MSDENKNIHDLIERYFDGHLTQEEERLLRDQLNENSDLKEAFLFQKKVQEDLQKASYIDKTRKQIKGTILAYQRKKRYTRYYAIAAGLVLLLAIPGVLTVMNRSDEGKLASGDQESVEIFQPEIKQPENYANSGEYKVELSMMSVQRNDTLYLFWEPALSDTSRIILNGLDQNENSRTYLIEPNASSLSISTRDISAGRYVWFIEGYNSKDTLQIK